MSEQRQPLLLKSVVAANHEQLTANLGDEVVILHLNAGAYYGLDQVGVFVWNFIQEPRKVSEICDAICEEYEVDIKRCEHDLLVLLKELADNQLIDIKNETDA